MIIEEFIVQFLSLQMPCNVYAEKPEDLPRRYLIVEKTGGSEESFINDATIVIQSYAESLLCAAELNEKVKETMNKLAMCNEITRCKLNTDYNYTELDTKQYRYQAVFDVTFY